MDTSALVLPQALRDLSRERLIEKLCKTSPAVWAEEKRGFENAPFHEEWYQLVANGKRVCVVAPREHAKTEVFTINATAWRSIYFPGTWTYVFSQTANQAEKMLERIVSAIEDVEPDLTFRMPVNRKDDVKLSNWSRITVAGAGKAVRSVHPDVIIGDDILSEDSTRSALSRQSLEHWWKGTVSGMVHPGTVRRLPRGRKAEMPPTRIFLIGTPFHQSDLLMGMKKNPMYHFRRYKAEYHESELVDGLAVEVS